jgi:hypothetical protein
VDTCESDFDTQIFWNWTPDCAQYELYNDECIDYGGFQTPGDPNAACYTPGGCISVACPGLSCLCADTVPGNTYTFLISQYIPAPPYATFIPPRCSSTAVNIVKKTSCDLGGPIPGGACCDRYAGTCTDGVDAMDCMGNGQIYSVNKLCSMVECDPILGACCNTAPGAGGSCSETLTGDCPVGQYQTWSEGVLCADLDPACAEVTGACCNRAPGAGGACVETIQADCPVGQYVSWSEGVDCGDLDPACAEVTGSCCNSLSGACSEGVTQGQCPVGADFTWTEGGTCSSCVARTGACCVEPSVTEAICTDGQTFAQCEAAGGVWSDSQSCDAVECLPDFIPIPTVSEWGLAVLALMLLIGGKIYFSRREAATA